MCLLRKCPEESPRFRSSPFYTAVLYYMPVLESKTGFSGPNLKGPKNDFLLGRQGDSQFVHVCPKPVYHSQSKCSTGLSYAPISIYLGFTQLLSRSPINLLPQSATACRFSKILLHPGRSATPFDKQFLLLENLVDSFRPP